MLNPPPVRFCETRWNKATSQLLIYVPPARRCAWKNDPWCTVGSKARRKSLPRLLMTLLASNPYTALYFSPWVSHLLFFPSLTCFLVYVQHATKFLFEVKMPFWPVTSFWLLAVLYNYTSSVSRQIEWASLSLSLCAVLVGSMASQLIPSLVFVELWNVCSWWTHPSAAIPLTTSRLCSTRGRIVDPRLLKMIRVTVHKIDRHHPLLPPNTFTSSLQLCKKFSCTS